MVDVIAKYLLAERRKSITLPEIKRSLNKKASSLRSIEVSYNGALQRQQRQLNKEIKRQIAPLVKQTIRNDAEGEDPESSFFDDLLKVITAAIVGGAVYNQIFNTTAQRVESVNYKKYDNGLYNKLGMNGAPTKEAIENWIVNNTNLIKDTNAKQLASIQRLLRDNAFSGGRAGSLEADITKIFRGTKKNIRLIAVDQTQKLGGQLDRIKQTDAGIPGYYWRTALDERVRSSHAELEGQYFSWDRPPAIGNPGQPIRCRCDAEPAVDRLLMTRKEFAASEKERISDDKANKKLLASYQKPKKT